jgi:hypothetical protein
MADFANQLITDLPVRSRQEAIAFTDQGGEEVVRGEASHLPEEGAGLIMVDAANASGSSQVWESLIHRRFQPSIHRRVSGVCLFEGGMIPAESRYDWLLHTKLITNPHAQVRLPDWLQAAVVSAGQGFERAASRW